MRENRYTEFLKAVRELHRLENHSRSFLDRPRSRHGVRAARERDRQIERVAILAEQLFTVRYARLETRADNTCPTCGAVHPACRWCGRPTICSPDEPGQPFAWCEDCERDSLIAHPPTEKENT